MAAGARPASVQREERSEAALARKLAKVTGRRDRNHSNDNGRFLA